MREHRLPPDGQTKTPTDCKSDQPISASEPPKEASQTIKESTDAPIEEDNDRASIFIEDRPIVANKKTFEEMLDEKLTIENVQGLHKKPSGIFCLF